MKQNQTSSTHPQSLREGIITAIAFGGFLILVGMVFAITPDLPAKINDFFKGFTNVVFPFPEGSSTSTMSLLAPANPAAHSVLYTAVMQFDIGFGILQAIILGLRLMVHSRRRKIAETVDHLIFWFGAAALVNVFLLAGTTTAWFEYWASLIILIGVGLVVRAIILLVKRQKAV
jgi:hypothetical protein